MKRLRIHDMLLGLLVLALTACAPMEPPASNAPGAADPNEPKPLAGTLWNLVGYGQPESLARPVADAPATLDIDAEYLAGTTGCNQYSYAYTLEGQTLRFAQPGPVTTLMACPDPLMQQEADFLKVMNAVTGYRLESSRLTLTGAEGVLVFEVAKALPLEGTAWQLTGMAQNEAVVNTYVDETITLTLNAGQATGFAGCNDYFGPYTIGTGLKFGPLASTKKACEGDPGQRETEFLTALERVAGYLVQRSQLTLLDGDGNLVMMFTALESR